VRLGTEPRHGGRRAAGRWRETPGNRSAMPPSPAGPSTRPRIGAGAACCERRACRDPHLQRVKGRGMLDRSLRALFDLGSHPALSSVDEWANAQDPQEDSDAVARGGPRGRIRSQRRTRRRTAASTPASGSALGRPRSRWPAASASRAVSAWERPPASARIADLAAWRRVTRPGPARRLQPLLHTGAARAGRSMVDRWRSRARGRPPSQPSSC
jgi:hypothetical protein